MIRERVRRTPGLREALRPGHQTSPIRSRPQTPPSSSRWKRAFCTRRARTPGVVHMPVSIEASSMGDRMGEVPGHWRMAGADQRAGMRCAAIAPAWSCF